MSLHNETWVRLLSCDSLSEGDMIGFEVGELRLVVYNVEGNFYVTDNVCTHAFAILSDGWLEGAVIECPLHGGRFDVTTGEVMSDPAECPLKTYPVRIAEDHVEVAVAALT